MGQADKRRGDVLRMLDATGIDAICTLIEEDHSLAAISKKLGCGDRTLREWLEADSTRSARAKESRIASAMACDEKAEQVLLELPANATAGQVARARELASHYRWRAKARNPRMYGDKLEVEQTLSLEVQSLAQALEALGTDMPVMIDVTPCQVDEDAHAHAQDMDEALRASLGDGNAPTGADEAGEMADLLG